MTHTSEATDTLLGRADAMARDIEMRIVGATESLVDRTETAVRDIEARSAGATDLVADRLGTVSRDIKSRTFDGRRIGLRSDGRRLPRSSNLRGGRCYASIGTTSVRLRKK